MPTTVLLDARDAAIAPPRGVGRYVRELAAALAQRDDVVVDAVHAGGRGPELAFEQLRLPALARRAAPDVLHAPNCFLPLRRPCPGVVTIHDLAFEEHPGDFSRRTGWKYRTFTPRAARSAERVVCVSAWTARDVERRYGVDPERIVVVPNAPSLGHGELPPPPGPYVLAVGDLRAKKNLVRLVRAFRTLRGQGLEHRLVLAGTDAGEGARLREEAGDAPVELTGWTGEEELDALMRGADALVHPSLYEGFGLVLLEAMVRGTPVIAARATALPETGGDAAAYFDPLDDGDLAAVLGRVLGDRGERERLAAAGRARAAEFSWARSARETVAAYEAALR